MLWVPCNAVASTESIAVGFTKIEALLVKWGVEDRWTNGVCWCLLRRSRAVKGSAERYKGLGRIAVPWLVHDQFIHMVDESLSEYRRWAKGQKKKIKNLALGMDSCWKCKNGYCEVMELKNWEPTLATRSHVVFALWQYFGLLKWMLLVHVSPLLLKPKMNN